mmetsp:Transcript_16680/g.65166  ORF Transcript_16680/g.65166 Transcript_16680/m.65166 type:complete len:853 (-) Transcript_16680:39-2597(-)
MEGFDPKQPIGERSVEDALEFADHLIDELLDDGVGAEEHYQQVCATRDAWAADVGADHPAVLSLRLGLAIYLMNVEEEQATQQAYDMLVDMQPTIEQRFGNCSQRSLQCCLRLAEALSTLGKLDEAAEACQNLQGLMGAAAEDRGMLPPQAFGLIYPQTSRTNGKIEEDRGNLDMAEEFYREAKGAAKMLKSMIGETDEELDVELYTCLSSLAQFLSLADLGQPGEVRTLLEEAHELSESLVSVEPMIFFDSSSSLATVYHRAGMHLEAGRLLEGACKLAEELYDPDDSMVIAAKANYGSLLVDLDEQDRALELLTEVKPVVVGTEHAVGVLESLACIYATRGKIKEAAQFHVEAVQAAEELHGEKSLEVVEALRAQAAFYNVAEQHDKATGAINRALALNEDIGVAHSQEVDLRILAAEILASSGDKSSARQHLVSALSQRTETVGRRHPLVARILKVQAEVEVEEEPSLAVELLREAISINEEAYCGVPHAETSSMLQMLADALIASADGDEQERMVEAAQLMAKAAEMNASLSGEAHPDTVQARMGVVTLLRAIGDLDASLAGAEAMVASLKDAAHEVKAGGYLSLAEAYDAAGRDEDQVKSITTAIEILSAMDWPSELLITAHHAMSEASATEDMAIEHQRLAVEAATNIHGPDSLAVSGELHAQAHLLLDTGRTADAITVMERSLALRRQLNAPLEDVADGCLGLALAYYAAEDYEKATQQFEEAYSLAGDSEEAGLLLPILANFGDFLITTGLDKERGAGFLLKAIPFAAEQEDYQALLNLPVQLSEELPAEPARWLPAFNQVWEAMEDDWEDISANCDPEVVHQFQSSFEAVKAAAQGRITKAAV